MTIKPVSGEIKSQDINDNLSYLDSEKADAALVASLGTGLGGAVDTLAQLQSLYPNGTNGFWIVQDNGHFYIWKNSTWSDMGLFQEAQLGLDSVDLEQTNFSKIVSKNLFNKATAVVGALNSTGAVVSTASFITSNYIAVLPGQVIKTSSNMQAFMFYNVDKGFVSGYPSAALNTATVPQNCYFVRVTFYYTNISTFMLAIGSLPTSYEPFKREITENAIGAVPGNKITNQSVSTKKLETTIGKNLADPENKVIGKYNVPQTGSTQINPEYNMYYMLPKPQEINYLTVTTCRFVTFYDHSKELLADLGLSIPTNEAPYTFDVSDSRIGYLSISYKNTADSHYQIESGINQTNYTKFGRVVKDLVVPMSAVFDDKSNENVDTVLNIPKKIFLSTGIQYKFFEKLLSDKPSDYLFLADVGEQKDGYYAMTFSSAKSTSIQIEQWRGDEVMRKRVEIIVSDPNYAIQKVMYFGDSIARSFTDAKVGNLIDELIKIKSSTIGVGTMLSSTGNGFEGRGGWSAATYRTNTSYEGVVNPFYDPVKKDFSMSYYLSTTSVDAPDVFIINLGTNEMFNHKNDTALKISIDVALSNFDYIINDVKSTLPNIKIAIHLTIPPTEVSSNFSASYNNNLRTYQAAWRYKRNNLLWVDALLKKYDGHYDLLTTNLVIDANSDISDGVHPKLQGYKKMAQIGASYLDSF